MEDFEYENWVQGYACCPDCAYVWPTVVPAGQFFTLTCPYCGGLIGELTDGKLVCA